MKSNTKVKLQGTAVALAVAGMMGCAQTASQSGSSGYTASNSAELGHCYGVNKCSGHNDCKTAKNACKGQASCKGHGFVAMPTKSCGDIGGTVKDEWRGEATTADMAHCYNVNVCGGHNDCKTANNACKGQASCKGQGFVKMSPKACNDVGGKVGK